MDEYAAAASRLFADLKKHRFGLGRTVGSSSDHDSDIRLLYAGGGELLQQKGHDPGHRRGAIHVIHEDHGPRFPFAELPYSMLSNRILNTFRNLSIRQRRGRFRPVSGYIPSSRKIH